MAQQGQQQQEEEEEEEEEEVAFDVQIIRLMLVIRHFAHLSIYLYIYILKSTCVYISCHALLYPTGPLTTYTTTIFAPLSYPTN